MFCNTNLLRGVVYCRVIDMVRQNEMRSNFIFPIRIDLGDGV